MLLPSRMPDLNEDFEKLDKMDQMVREFEGLYEEMSEAHAEGRTAGYSDKQPDCM